MIGHTDRATINKRKQLTPGMRELLLAMAKQKVSGHRMREADKNRARALMDRGYALPDDAGWWSATEEGKAAVDKP